jgi:hypothetical protein
VAASRTKLQQLLAKTAAKAWTGGVRCGTCQHERVAAVNADIHEFAKARAAGHRMPWSVFCREYLAPEYALGVGAEALRKHARKCLGAKI